MLDFRQLSRAKVRVFSTISFAALVLVFMFMDSFISNVSLQSVVLQNQQPLKFVAIQEPDLGSEKVEVKEDTYSEDQADLVPPFNLTERERISWFKKKLPDFGILKPTNLTGEFDNRVQEFLKNDCKIQFFMTWISPARSFGGREILAMESLFKAHPQGCLMILSRTLDSVRGLRILKPLIDRKFRVLAVAPDLSFLFKDTPAESWFDDIKNGEKDPGEIPLGQNLSNLIRLAVLYKYGGVYLDTDFIVLQDFSGLRNSIGAQSADVSGNWTRLNNAVLVFDKNHTLLHKFILEFALTFDGNKWGHNGPYLVSRVVARETTRGELNFTVLPPMAFYPVYWTRVESLFVRPKTQVDSKWVEAKLLQLREATYGVHLWNKQSSRLRIEEGSIMGRLVSEHRLICRIVYSS
ncbi:hypothetical protein RJ639_016925 [Escallonia herrerae]|uniref:Alpha 1,4-glycosyltransferase domain-containing protein n=1 Tax=Escallonia herrerae TaxID=1293975 RepID=A0AA88VB93_9ASTE|nr:hypothetical protein RJ639_016925 [Escallonia herrerae]